MEHTANSRVQLFISCRKLRDTDVMSKSDPFVEVYEQDKVAAWKKIGLTEVIDNNLNPDFVTSFELAYFFEENQPLKFVVYDSDDKKAIPHKKNIIGEVICTLAEIQGAQGQQLIRTLRHHNKPCGNIILRTEQISENEDSIIIQFGGENLEDNGGFFHSYKPFFCLNRVMESGSGQKVYMSEHAKGKNVNWKLLTKPLRDLCNGDLSRPIKFELWDHHRSGNHDMLASCEFSINKITEEGIKKFVLINPKKHQKNKKYKDSGFVVVRSCQIIKNYTIMDYIRGGCQISLSIAIDFTASNGIPSNPTSLHFMHPNGMNQYEQALHSVSQILLNYDGDKQVPVYGFGGKINGMTSHCFHVNFNPNNPNVSGLEEIMRSYRNALRYVELNGPTLFAQFLGKIVAEIESQPVNQSRQVYNVLLILTDGEIHDQQDTINLIVRGSALPLSIVIVGIGNDGFTNMRQLDADDVPLVDSRGNKMLRDIVQFVPFREMNNSPQRLAKEVLAEIPREVTGFFKMKNIYPNPPVMASEYDYNRSYSIAAPQGISPYSENPEIFYAPPPAVNAMSQPVYGSMPPASGKGYPQGPPGNMYQTVPNGVFNPPAHGVYNPPPQGGYQSVPHPGYQSVPPPANPNPQGGYAYAPPPN